MCFRVPLGRDSDSISVTLWKWAGAFLLSLGLSSSDAAEPRDYAVEIAVEAHTDPLALELRWPSTGFAREYTLRRRIPGDSGWGAPVATLPSSASGYTDSSISNGSAYEYEVRLETTIPASPGVVNAYGYAYAGVNVPVTDYKGKAILIVDSSIAAAISAELTTFERDLAGSGWSIARHEVSRLSSVVDVKNLIRSEYESDPETRAVVLIGHVPVPYSGNISPDLHERHRGAWPADVYYADMDGTWTDTTVNVTSVDNDDNDNHPGDGKFDQSQIPSAVELEIGRIDFWNLPAFAPRTEVDLLRAYFRKNHEFRHRLFTAARQGLIRDNFGDLGGDAPAVDAWRHYPQFFGAGHTREVGPDAFLPTLASESFLWAYGCGGGGYTKADGVGSSLDFALSDPKAVFLMLHGSYFGDWNNRDNLLRAALAAPGYSLASVWTGLPHWFMHPMGLGATLGHSTRITQNNVSDYKSHRNFSPQQVHISLLGDPTLEMFPVVPPSNLSGAPGATVNLNWTLSTDENVAGCHVYYSANVNGPFQRLTSNPVTGGAFSHAVSAAGTYHYMVRAVKLERTGSGTFYNASQGVFTTVTTTSGGGTPPTVAITLEDGDVAESGPNPGTFKISRDPANANPLTIEFLIGGTAQNGVDYVALETFATIPGGKADVLVPITPLKDALVEEDESITLLLRPVSAYTVGSPSSGFLRIADAPRNQPPVALPQNLQGIEDTPMLILLTGTDPDNDALTFNLITGPTRGTLTGRDENYQYSPGTNFFGQDSIVFQALDGAATSAPATITIQIEARNDPPQISAVPAQAARKNALAGPYNLSVDDVDRPINELALSAFSSNTNLVRAENITVSAAGASRSITLQPEPNATGVAIIELRVSDGEATAKTTFSFTVTNTSPVPRNDLIGAYPGPLRIPISELLRNDDDADGDALTIVSVAGPQPGNSVALTNGFVICSVPREGGAGDSFAYTVEDSSGARATAEVQLRIEARPKIEAIELAGGLFVLRVSGPSSSAFTIQASADARRWIPLGTETTDQSGRGLYQGSIGQKARRQFYQVVWPQ